MKNLLARLDVQDAATRFRLEHYLRRYHASDCDAPPLFLAADWMSALLSAGLPQACTPDHSVQTPAASLGCVSSPLRIVQPTTRISGQLGGGSEVVPTASQSVGPGLGILLDTGLRINQPDSLPSDTESDSDECPECWARQPASALGRSHGDDRNLGCGDVAGPSGAFAYLWEAAAEVARARAVLQSSYISDYFMGWGPCRRCDIRPLSGAVECQAHQEPYVHRQLSAAFGKLSTFEAKLEQ